MIKNKNTVIPPIRIDEDLDVKITNQANKYFPKLIGKNKSKYIRYLIEQDLKDGKQPVESIDIEKRLMIRNLTIFGTNLNQIAHSLNIIKKKENITLSDKENIKRINTELQKIQISVSKFTI